MTLIGKIVEATSFFDSSQNKAAVLLQEQAQVDLKQQEQIFAETSGEGGSQPVEFSLETATVSIRGQLPSCFEKFKSEAVGNRRTAQAVLDELGEVETILRQVSWKTKNVSLSSKQPEAVAILL